MTRLSSVKGEVLLSASVLTGTNQKEDSLRLLSLSLLRLNRLLVQRKRVHSHDQSNLICQIQIDQWSAKRDFDFEVNF